jgi:HTH-type transcriptional repressor of NAD biosynthesis genes
VKTGFVCGKFLPLHKGHELLLHTAISMCDYLVVVVGVQKNDPWSFEQRRNWVAEAIDWGSCTYQILCQEEHDRESSKRDGNGTITDEEWWRTWVKDTKYLLDMSGDPVVDCIFSSDKYGERIAKEFKAQWIPVDPKREIITIRASDIRWQPTTYWEFMPSYVQRDLVKTIALVGPESTGKSTLAMRLGLGRRAPWVSEYGRILCEHRGLDNMTLDDYDLILTVQQAFINNAKMRMGHYPLVITDTEALVTSLWYEYRFQKKFKRGLEEFRNQYFDLYLLMAPTVPIVNDGTRVMTEIDRWRFFNSCLEHLEKEKKNYKIIDGGTYETRTNQVNTAIQGIMKWV